MLFYCPSCRKEYEAEPKETITTKGNRVAYKANCPVCQQDMAEFVPPQANASGVLSEDKSEQKNVSTE